MVLQANGFGDMIIGTNWIRICKGRPSDHFEIEILLNDKVGAWVSR
jgi:hypothetical protein